MKDMLRVAVSAAKSSGSYISKASKKTNELEVSEKQLHDYVSEVDRNSEIIITTLIAKHFPEHRILGEEYGHAGGTKSDYQWVIDPLDGTTNFLHSIAHYAVSIALIYQGEIVIGVVYDAAKDELFHAVKGEGAFLNEEKIGVSDKTSISGALIATGIPFNGENLEKVSSFTATMENILALQTSGIRRLGAAALDLAYIACGRYDGFWETNLQPWDIAAGILLVTEAGGVVTDLNGGNNYLQTGNILASNISVHSPMLSVTDKYNGE